MSFKDDKRYIQDFWWGTTQTSRLPAELVPDFVHIDELTISDLVRFTNSYSQHIVFHRDASSSLPNSQWQEFFKKDYLYLLFFISNEDPKPLRKVFVETWESANLSPIPEVRQKKYADLFAVILHLVKNLYDWYETLEYNDYTKDLINFFSNIFNNELNVIWKKLEPFKHEILGRSDKNKWLEIAYETLISKISSQAILTAQEKQENPDALEVLNTSFNTLYSVTEYLSKESSQILSLILTERKDNKSNMALFIAFLQVYKNAQGELNTITRRHLEFYYNRILQQSADDTLPDKAYLCVTLDKGTQQMVLQKGLSFDAGKDADGKKLNYELLADTFITNTEIKQIHTLYVSKNNLNYTGLNEPCVTDIFYDCHFSPADRPPGWAIFGEDQFFKGTLSKTMNHANIGFIIASNALTCSEGDRNVSIDLICTKDSYQDFKSLIQEIADNSKEAASTVFTRIFTSAFDFSLTIGGKETPIERFAINDNPYNNGLTIHLELSVEDAPISAPSKDIVQTIPIQKPYAKLLLRSESHIYAYPLIQKLALSNIVIHTEVTGANALTLQNDLGPVNPALPFPPFGVIPVLGSSFLLGSNEIFSKNLTELSVTFTWSRLPNCDKGWETYFKAYDANIHNEDYKVGVSFLKNGVWQPMHQAPTFPLFEEKYSYADDTLKLSETTHFTKVPLSQISYTPSLGNESDFFDNTTRNGFLKFELINPNFCFGHADYSKKLSEVTYHNALLKPDEEEEPLPVPQMPITPLLTHVHVDYKASTAAFQDNRPTNDIDLYKITPFGYRNVHLKFAEEMGMLLEPFEEEGNLYLGLDKYPQDGFISFFFHLQEGHIEDYLRKIPVPTWQYLSNNTWHTFEAGDLISDTTNSFIRSGIVSLRIPNDIQLGNTIVDSQLFWIKVSVSNDAEVAAYVNKIFVNALTVQWDGMNHKKHLDNPLPPYSIKKLNEKLKEIKTVEQPIGSFGGKKIEDTYAFYQRVSERLRHKHRAVNVWDYERLILNKFPIIYRVKCFTANTLHSEVNKKNQKYLVKPGSLKIVLIPDIDHPEVRNNIRPKVSINVLAEIQSYLQKIASPFAEIDVSNPFYEWIKVIATVKFKHTESGEGLYVNMLNEDLKKFLTPWLWSKNSENQNFGNSVFESRILSFMQNRTYVDFVTGFSIVKTWNDGKMGLTDSANGGEEELKPLYPWSILVSSEQHDIQVIAKETHIESEKRAIGNMVLGSDLVINH